MSVICGPLPMLRLGLCCTFLHEPIKFRRTTAKHLAGLRRREALSKRDELVRHNARALWDAIRFCADKGIGAFRINSQFIPLATHPNWIFDCDRLQNDDSLAPLLRRCRNLARRHGVRLSFHPDQFVVLSSPREDVAANSLAELEYQAAVAQAVGADMINIHGGGAYEDKPAALARFAERVKCLSRRARSRLTVENDDRVYTPSELLPVCARLKIPLVYDVHHHRCLADGLSVSAATDAALGTWNRTPHFHVSSPLSAWGEGNPRPHHDFIDPGDIPACWRRFGQPVTIDVEAKAKEAAVLALQDALG